MVIGAIITSTALANLVLPAVYTLLDDPLWFVAGVRLPLFALPVWIKAIGLAFPLTSSLVVLRGALLDGLGVRALLGPLALLAGLCAVLFAATVVLLRVGEAQAQRTGSLQLF